MTRATATPTVGGVQGTGSRRGARTRGMRAATYERYGAPDVLTVRQVARPRIADDQVLVRVRSAGVNPYDWHFVRGEPFILRLVSGLRRPSVGRLGADLAGQVVEVGAAVERFRVGDEVFGDIASVGGGSLAQYAAAPERLLAHKPEEIGFDGAAALPMAGLTALQGLRDEGGVSSGSRVLIVGASGGVGTLAVQIARRLGARVTAVCSTRNLELVRRLGAEHAIDYSAEDFTRSNRRYDVILDLVGTHPIRACRRVLDEDGTYVLAGDTDRGRFLGPLKRVLRLKLVAPLASHTLRTLDTHANHVDLATLATWVAQGSIRPVIEARYTLDQVADAVRHVETGHTRGKVVVTP